jgi:hypothetical protein
MLRVKNYQTLVNISKKLNDPDLLEARFAVEANDQFHKISDKVKEEIGVMDSKRIFFEWNDWLKRAARAHTMRAQK